MQSELENARNKIIDDYRQKAELRFSEYEAADTTHCSEWLHHVKKPPAAVLDIGSGSGRDAAYYAQQGYDVTAVEPAAELRALAQKKHGHLKNITWIDDQLPELVGLRGMNKTFDHINMNAVIFHIPKEYTKDVLTAVHTLLNPGGTFYVSIRGGWTDPARPMFDVTKEHVLAQAKNFFDLVDSIHRNSKTRADVTWDLLFFRKKSA